MRSILRGFVLFTFVGLVAWGVSALAVGSCTLQIVEINAEKFPDVYLTVRAFDDNGITIKGLENDFNIQESTSQASSTLKPDVVRNDKIGAPVAVSIVLDTRNDTGVEQLTAAREFALNVVIALNNVVPLGKRDSDYVSLWAPTLSTAAATVPWEQGTLSVLGTTINQKVFPSSDTSEGLDILIRDLIESDTPGNAPHVIIVAGKVANVQPVIDAAILHTQALQQPHNVLIYTAGVSGSDENYLRQLANARYVAANGANASVIVGDIFSRLKGEYVLHYQSELTPTDEERKIRINVEGDVVCNDVERSFAIPNVIEIPGVRNQATLILIILGVLAIVGVVAWWYAAWIFGAIKHKRRG